MMGIYFYLLTIGVQYCYCFTTISKPEVNSESYRGNVVSAVTGSDVNLPCDARLPHHNDTLLLVAWYKEDYPIYSFDNRVRGPRAHWSEAEGRGHGLGSRARWQMSGENGPVLHIRQITSTDAGVYRCRVDFRISPTRNEQIKLKVIVLPSKPTVFDEFGKEIKGIAGPYYEGGSFQITCMVSGGKPSPRIQWWRDDKILASSESSAETVNTILDAKTLALRVHNLTRSHLHATYTCTADNTQYVPPLKTSVQIELYLRPLSVAIQHYEQPLSAGRSSQLICRSSGGRPPAELSWWLDGNQLINATTQENLDENNVTLSTLTWTPELVDNGKVMTCKGKHPTINHSSIESTLPLNIQFVPIVTLQLGSKMNPYDIEEGDDVYFECIVRANPPAYKVLWEHNGVVMQHNQRAGVIDGGDHLAIQGVTRRHSGRYACIASNVEGDGKSPPVNLQVMFKPICRENLSTLYGAALHEKARVVCLVDSHPPPDSFTWMLNNSGKAQEVDSSRYTIESGAGRSILTYTPTSELDYGTLSCRASNLAGVQYNSCLFTIVPASKPDTLKNCSISNVTDREITIHCVPGYDGGLKTTYILEAWSSNILMNNISSSSPDWIASDLAHSTQLKLIAYATNKRGRSAAVNLNVKTLERIEPRSEAQEAWQLTWAIGGVIGATLTVAFVFLISLFITKLRKTARDYEVSVHTVKSHKSSPDLSAPDDKNPDVVPLNKGKFSLGSGPEPPTYAAAISGKPTPPMREHSQHNLRSTTVPTTQTVHTPHAPTFLQNMNDFTRGLNTTLPRREIVTTRTPLLASTQESCV